MKEEGLKLIFTGEGEKNSIAGINEIKFYKRYLNKFLLVKKKGHIYISEHFQSKLIIGLNSTMLREKVLALIKKFYTVTSLVQFDSGTNS